MDGEELEEFTWRRNGPMCIDIKENGCKWLTKFYDFCLTSTDCGIFPTLIELDSEKRPLKGFGIFEIPLTYYSEDF